MRNKVTEITEVPRVISIPDGTYWGTWGGNIIDMTCFGKAYKLTTEVGVRGFDIKVAIEIKDGVATFETIDN